jgi:hypothetical protein
MWQKFNHISEVLAASIIISLMMEVAYTSETSVIFYHMMALQPTGQLPS